MFNNQPDVIKRGSKIIFLQYRQIAFVDAMAFGPGCSLDDFGKMWGANVRKGCFPYEKYTTIEDLAKDTQWPTLEDFKSKLSCKTYNYSQQQLDDKYQEIQTKLDISKQEFFTKIGRLEMDSFESPIDLNVYCQMWIVFEQGKRNKSINNMLEFLCFYNSLDTEVLTEAMEKYISSFLENFGVCPNEFITLPAIAEKILWQYYDNDSYQPYSFNEEFSDVSKLIRSQLAGGLSCVFSRHVEVGMAEMKYDSSVYHAANGKRFTQLIAFDVNSKYSQYNYHKKYIKIINSKLFNNEMD